MRSAAHRRRDEASPEPPPRDLAQDAAALLDRAEALLPLLEAGRAGVRTVDEMVFLGRALGDLTAALEDAAAGQSVVEAVDAAAYARGWDAREAAGQARAPGPRHAGRRRHLASVPGIPGTAARAAAAAGIVVVAGLGTAAVAGMHEESAVSAVAAPARHAALRPMAPDRAVAIPSPSWSPSPRPSMAAAAASPAPAVTPSPSAPATSSPPPPAPVPSATVTPAPVLGVPRFLDLGDSILGQLQLSATGPGEVAWTATATDGIRLSSYAGVVVPGEPVTLQVTDPTGNGGWAYISFGGTTVPVEVTSDVGTPVLALP